MSPWIVALLVVCLAAFAAILLPLVREREPWDKGALTSELDEIFAAKSRTLRALKDLDHEREAGLLSQEDWGHAREAHLAEAVRLNRRIAALTGVDPAAAGDPA